MALQNREVEKVTAAALESTFGWTVSPLDVAARASDPIRIGSTIRLSGGWNGEIVVFLSPELARRAAVAMFQPGGGTVDAGQMQEAVRQLTGQIAADLREEMRHPCQLHVPSPATISGGTIRRADAAALLDCDGEPCWVLVDGSVIAERGGPVGPSRRFSRADVKLGVTVSAGGTVHRSNGPSNLSMTGVFVRGESSIPRGCDCIVRVYPGQGGEAEAVQVVGRVARVTPEGFAVEFLEVGFDSYRQLRDLVHSNSSSPSEPTPRTNLYVVTE